MRWFLIAVLTVLILLLAAGLLSGVGGGSQPPASRASAQEDVIVPSPLNGLLSLSEVPGGPPAVEVGDHVTTGKVLCVVDNMPVRAMVSGTVMEIMVQDGQMVTVTQPLFRIRTP
jgi:acetyl-CoA carboxylase biotin carboxyl carrier protein